MTETLPILSLLLGVAALTIQFVVPEKYQKVTGMATIFLVGFIAVLSFLDTYSIYVLLAVSIVLNFVFYRKQNFMRRLVDFFEEKYKREEFAEIIRWGGALSKPLWLSQNIKIRLKIGKYVEKSAPNLGNNMALVKALINDIGWTKIELKDYSEAEEVIKEGIKIAEKEINKEGTKASVKEMYHYMIAKGYRHLFGSYIRQDNNLKKAKEYLDKSYEIIDTELAGINKVEMIAEYYFAKALFECCNGEHHEALEDIKKAEQGYSNLKEKEWKIKIMARKGDIMLASQQDNYIDEAIKIFNDGLEKSQKYQYLQQELNNLRGLGTCYIVKGKEYNNEARKNLNRAKKIATKLSLTYELGKIEEQISNLNSKQT